MLPFPRLKLPRYGIQTRLLLVTLTLGLLFIVYGAFSAVRQSGQDREDMRERLRLMAALAGSRLDDHIGDVAQVLTTLAATLPVETADAERNDAVLRALTPQLPANVAGVSLWAADGSNIGSSEFLAAGPRPSARERAFFIAARSNPGLATEAPVRLHSDGEWTAVFALRVVREAQVIGVVSIATRLATLPRLLDPEETLPAGAVIALANADARIVTRSLEPERWIGKPAPIDRVMILRRLAEGRGNAEGTGLDGSPRMFGFAGSRAVSWLVYIGIPVASALAPANANLRTSLLLGLGTLGAGLCFAAWVAGRIARPLRELSADARLLGEGRFDHRSRVHDSSEIGLLAQTLNRMAAALQERTAAARRSEERLSLALEGSGQALFDWDIVRNRVHYSAAASALRGGPSVDTDLPPDVMRSDVHPDDLPGVLKRMEEAVRGVTPVYEAEFRVRHRSGRWIWLRSRGRVVEHDADGRALRLVGTDADITEHKHAESKLRKRAELDALTGLPNRAVFDDRLADAIERAVRSGKTLALLFLDIDHFKSVNDTRGHAAGDALLRIAAERLLATVRAVDTVARLAGDEFTVILEGLAGPEDAEAIAGKLVEALREPVSLAGTWARVSTSIGIAVLEPGERDPASLLRRADEALYEAKRRGRDRYARRPTVTV